MGSQAKLRSDETIAAIRSTLATMSVTHQNTMSVAWNTMSAVLRMEVNREIVETLHAKPEEEDEHSLMQTSAPGGGRDRDGRRENEDKDKIPGRLKKYKRTSRRRTPGTRRRTIEEELAELGANVGGDGRNIVRSCDKMATRLRHVLGGRLMRLLGEGLALLRTSPTTCRPLCQEGATEVQ